MMTTKYKPGDKVRIDGVKGHRYRVVEYGQDGSVKLYGGAQDPNGWRGVKSVSEERLIPVKK